MFEKLRRYRADRERCVGKIEELQSKLNDLDAKIREEEASTIIGVMSILELNPEKAAEMLGYHEEEKKPVPKKSNSEKSSEKKEAADISGKDAESIDDNEELEDVLNEVY